MKKKLYCSEYFYLNNNKKLLIWYKKWKSENVLMLIVIEKCEKVRKIMGIGCSTTVFCSGVYQTTPIFWTKP
jgi:hypothetical protein